MKRLMGFVFSLALAMSTNAYTQDFPTREVEIVVNYGAGGVTDVATRLLSRTLSKHLGRPTVVTNKPGGQATLGPAYLSRQQPDGYTTGIITFSAVAITPHMIEVPYTVDDFDFLGGFGRYRYGLAVNNNSPYNSVEELVDAARKSGEPLFFGVPGAPNNVAFLSLRVNRVLSSSRFYISPEQKAWQLWRQTRSWQPFRHHPKFFRLWRAER